MEYKICINLANVPGFNKLKLDSNNDETEKTMLNKVTCKTDNNLTYKIIRYDKNYLTSDNILTSGLCRSVIVNCENMVVGFSPPKSINPDEFIRAYGAKNENIIAQEFVEGTMINVFWDNKIGLTGGWEISTRNRVGAKCKYFNNNKSARTFRELFLDAAELSLLNLEMLNKNNCYSFVLQHPENRIVVPFTKPTLYLIAVYSIRNDDANISTIITVEDLEYVKNSNHFDNTLVCFPEKYDCETYSELIEKYASMNSPYNIVGFVLYNRTNGVRTKVRNPAYEQIKQLRGNNPKNQYQYLCLRGQNKVAEYLKVYPEHKSDFSEYRDQVHLFSETLFSDYLGCYVKKERPLLEFSSQFRTHMFNIHKIYVTELKEKKQHITKMVVIKYVNELAPALLMHSLNYQFRKRNVDFINSTEDD